ncbi:ABC transporter ATP-binding protein [Agrococcus jejuensis]|uniref:ABC transporter ATP-binding protein n=1 Tax=Agrococcus jejuensis TaxID=399736 RepID=UPI0028D3DF31|nr:ABC transporter ATP-binding protein [Agrococcus jejuensis]
MTDAQRLSATDLRLAYGRQDVVHDASITLEPGRVTVLVGPNGSGKSTLLRGLTSLHRPSDGAILYGDGIMAADLSERQLAQRVAMLSQSRPTPSGVTVREVVEYGRFPHRGRMRRRDPEGPGIVDRALAATGVAELADRPVAELSGGQRQRVWLASCLAQQTGIVLLDEPTTYLDLRFQVEILDIVRDLAADGVAVGVVLHDLDQAADVADDAVLLVDGRIVAAGAPADVLTAERLSAAYGVAIDVVTDEDGHLHVRPARRTRRTPAAA